MVFCAAVLLRHSTCPFLSIHPVDDEHVGQGEHADQDKHEGEKLLFEAEGAVDSSKKGQAEERNQGERRCLFVELQNRE